MPRIIKTCNGGKQRLNKDSKNLGHVDSSNEQWVLRTRHQAMGTKQCSYGLALAIDVKRD